MEEMLARKKAAKQLGMSVGKFRFLARCFNLAYKEVGDRRFRKLARIYHGREVGAMGRFVGVCRRVGFMRALEIWWRPEGIDGERHNVS